MHENIEKIAKQCHFTESNIGDLSPGLNDFALSLIRKCLELIEPIHGSDNEKKIDAEKAIKEYFGMEENKPKIKP